MALASMTGFGSARAAKGAVAAEVEARSVNGRGLQLRCRVPGDRLRLEPKLEALVRRTVERGSVELRLRLSSARARSLPRIDRRVLAMYRDEARRLGGPVEPALLLGLPGVIRTSDSEPSESLVESVSLLAARRALSALSAARDAEGARLRSALRREIAALRRLVAAIRRRVPLAVARQSAQLLRRVAELCPADRLSPDDPALRREIALLADRGDVTEEIDRLLSHLDALEEALERGGAVGRRLEFLLQEVARELNTLGAKAGDVVLAARVIDAKSVAERLREQAANLE